MNLCLCISFANLFNTRSSIEMQIEFFFNLNFILIQSSDEPPDLVSGESGDESSNGSQSELSDLTSSDECDEDFAEQVIDKYLSTALGKF